jgi:SAM-dependent methyltransferase
VGLVSILGSKHSAVSRDYESRVCDHSMPKHRAASLAKKWGRDYWDGDRRTGYGGYQYIPGYWREFASNLVQKYQLTAQSRVLDIGCGKGFLLAELEAVVPGIQIRGVDISEYAIAEAPEQLSGKLEVGDCATLPFGEKEFDLAISINVFHNLVAPKLVSALKEISRVSIQNYIVVESYVTELQKQNLLFWQLTCEAFNTPEGWEWWFDSTGYSGDWEFIYFD